MEELKNVTMAMPTAKPARDDPRASKMGIQQGYHGNVCYVASTILMDGDKVLLIQEADPRLKGSWYLPAGLVDPGETIAVRLNPFSADKQSSQSQRSACDQRFLPAAPPPPPWVGGAGRTLIHSRRDACVIVHGYECTA